MSGKVDEVKAGGVEGIFGIDQLDWGSHGGKIYEVWKLEPCCGSPVNPESAVECMAHWICCAPCSLGKLLASSAGDACGVFPHALCAWFCPLCACVFARYNMRHRVGVSGNIVGDIICTWCCSICAHLQLLRAATVQDWALFPCNVVPFAPDAKVLV